DALELVEGKLAFAVLGGKLKMTHIDEIHEEMGTQHARVSIEDAE
ncbi:MAG TPA: ribonuclease D, partial [Novosphingobium sp.]